MKNCIKFDKANQSFDLTTKNTVYSFGIRDGQHLIHYYYGEKKGLRHDYDFSYQCFSPFTQDSNQEYSPDIAPAELPFFGSGDYREDALRIRNENGDSCTLFKYKSYEIFDGRKPLVNLPYNLPYADADEYTQTLCITMEDEVSQCTLELYYTVFPECDTISRYYTVTYNGQKQAKIEKSMSLSLDIMGWDQRHWLSLNGGYYSERINSQRATINLGRQGICSNRGSSSHHRNPFIAVMDENATEDKGEVYGFNFVYSGSYLDEIERDHTGVTRVQVGLGQDEFEYLLNPGESFTTPEAVMTYSCNGIGQMSRNFHDFIRSHIVPKKSLTTPRPVVLNTWEASYFEIDEGKLLQFADAAHDVGIDMLVMDDGWFGQRNHDHAGLGDWYTNTEKFPDGLDSFVRKVKAKGVKFGIWIEPEMVNPDSDLYRAHPEWCCTAKGRTPTISRNQLVLDMANPAVVEYLKQSFTKTFKDVPIDYIKWDYNRNMAEVASNYLSTERQGEAWFRYMIGTYELYQWFMDTFPNVMIENCSGGGGRYDLGMMKYSYQIWASDNTSPDGRIGIQNGSVTPYPASVMSCHVSNSGNLTSDPRKLDFAYITALNGVLGYELNLPAMPQEVKDTIKKQVSLYHEDYEDIIKNGSLHKIHDVSSDGIASYYFVSKDASQILLSFLQPVGEKESRKIELVIPDADTASSYKDKRTGKVYSGEELSMGFAVNTDTNDFYGLLFDLRKM